MHMQLLPDDTVVMFDRTDTGRSNISLPDGSRCTTDCTAHSVLFHLYSSSVRPLTVLTDTWCSSGTLLANGTLLQTGGFKDGDRVIRFFSPSPHSDWVELPSYLAVRRWYASNQILPDGRVIIIGGRRQFSGEFFPRDQYSASPVFQLPFLVETYDRESEGNLYPFLHLLPDGTLFVFANDRAIVLDVASKRAIRRLPAILDGPRSYPSTASSVLLPLRPGAAAEVLVCGGAPLGSYQAALNGTFLPALSSCARIKPSDPEPSWSMEDMPLARVMGDMVLLPTCHVIIVNGAAAGTAGWELAREPVLYPVLYQPDLPEGTRFSVLRESQIPRMYHSTAVLDTHGRVLVGGSNPHSSYKFTDVMFPTELSLEAFYPPYLLTAAEDRPRVLAAPAEVGYGERVAVRFLLAEHFHRPWLQELEDVEVVAVSPAFQTHSVGMNQRVVVLETSRTLGHSGGYETEVMTPPSPAVSPPGYYLWFVVHEGVPSKGVWVRIG
ncbi:aldehyde oxidase GLOX-like [Curcuma longa]|uniref:aldehyde oxidase GLOX-like n=1 Tax=Curcuma longa TaxID=136217 RepID=UPI003D9DFB72